jgi:hypothetical protein
MGSLLKLSLLGIVKAVAAVQLVGEAKSRIPVGLQGLTFYSQRDEWVFLSSGHPNICADCVDCDGNVFLGSELRSAFPYHTILDENIIAASVHPNCSCLLLRAISVGGYM